MKRIRGSAGESQSERERERERESSGALKKPPNTVVFPVFIVERGMIPPLMAQTTGELSNRRRLSKLPRSDKSPWTVKSLGLTYVLGRTMSPGRSHRMSLSGQQPIAVVRHLRELTDHTSVFSCGTSGEDSGTPSASLAHCWSRTSAATPARQ